MSEPTKPEQRDMKMCPFCNKKVLQRRGPEWLEFDCDCLTVDEDGNIFIPNDILHEYWTETRRTAVREDEAVKGLVEAFGEDTSGRLFSDLLRLAHVMLRERGDGPVADCLCIKADEVDESLSRFEEKHGKI